MSYSPTASSARTSFATTQAPPIEPADLTALARTCDDATQPIWIYDATAQCVYRNGLAARIPSPDRTAVRFEILDPRGQPVGHLATAAHERRMNNAP
jgi:hypothetical protein